MTTYTGKESTGQTNDQKMSRASLEVAPPMELCAGRRTAPGAHWRPKNQNVKYICAPLLAR